MISNYFDFSLTMVCTSTEVIYKNLQTCSREICLGIFLGIFYLDHNSSLGDRFINSPQKDRKLTDCFAHPGKKATVDCQSGPEVH